MQDELNKQQEAATPIASSEPANAPEPKAKKEPIDPEKVLELIVVIMLGITGLLTAWASWTGALHGGNQTAQYTESTNLVSQASSEYNKATQLYNTDLLTWQAITPLLVESSESSSEEVRALAVEKINAILEGGGVTEEFWQATQDVIELYYMTGKFASPFVQEGYGKSYYVRANGMFEDAQIALDKAEEAGANGDAYGLVTVLYALVLFLLGIDGTVKSTKNKIAILVISAVAFAASTVYMLTIPLPDGFSFFGL